MMRTVIFLMAIGYFSTPLCAQQDAQQNGSVQSASGKTAVIDNRSADKKPELGALFFPRELADGAKIRSVFTNGPCHQQRVYSGDWIVQLDQSVIQSEQDVVRFMLTRNPGDRVDVKRVRDGVALVLTVTLMSRKKLLEVSNTGPQRQANNSRQYVARATAQESTDFERVSIEQRIDDLQKQIEELRKEINQLKQDNSSKGN